MSALLTIIAACQISAGGCPSPKVVDQYQLKCQKELIECYSKKLAAQEPTGEKNVNGTIIVPNRAELAPGEPVPLPWTGTWKVISPEEREWKGPLKDCILARQVR